MFFFFHGFVLWLTPHYLTLVATFDRTQRILHSIFCSRVLLHIRGAYTNSAFASTTRDSQNHIQSGGQYAFRRQNLSGLDSSNGRGYSYGRRGLGRDTFELTSVDVQSPTSPIDGGDDDAPGIKGWGLGHGYEGTPQPPVSDDAPKYIRRWTDSPDAETMKNKDGRRERVVLQGNIRDAL